MTNILLFIIIFVLAAILYFLRQISLALDKRAKLLEKSKRLRTTLFPIFSEAELFERKRIKDELYRQIKELETSFTTFEQKLKQFKASGQAINLSPEIENQLQQLASLILKKNRLNKEYNQMIKLNISVANGHETYDKAWQKISDIVDAQRNHNKEELYIKDFVERRKRLLKKI